MESFISALCFLTLRFFLLFLFYDYSLFIASDSYFMGKIISLGFLRMAITVLFFLNIALISHKFIYLFLLLLPLISGLQAFFKLMVLLDCLRVLRLGVCVCVLVGCVFVHSL